MKLRITRIIFSSIVFILFIYVFFVSSNLSIIIGNILNYFQFIPSILKFISSFFSFLALGFISVLVLTFFFGRIYCSFLCPLGIFQDIIIFISQKFTKKFKFIKPFNWARYSILIIVIFFSFSGFFVILNSLDPYSIFGRIISDIFKPIYMIITNQVVSFLKYNKIYINLFYKIHKIGIGLLLFSSFSFMMIIVFSILKGRLYCNTICSVGTLLGFISKYSIFSIGLDDKKCTACHLCEKTCKAGCIDSKNKEVDLTRCISCFNCLDICPQEAIDYSKRSLLNKNGIDYSRREFIKYLFPASVLSFGIVGSLLRKPFGKIKNKMLKNINSFISPPGSLNINNFINNCTACHYCVSSCPTKVLKPAAFFGTMQPAMDYSYAFCDYECNICSRVCPSGAIKPIELELKKRTQIGKVALKKEECIVYKYNLDCGACSEHCPTKAVYMVPFKDVYGPETNTDICIGCGACEFACPSSPITAITVKGNNVHQKIKKVEKPDENEKENDAKEIKKEDFPF